MDVPVIKDVMFKKLINSVESGFPWETSTKAEETMKKGIMTMEILLNIDNDGNYRGRVMRDRKVQLLKDSIKVNSPELYKKVMLFFHLIVVFSFIAVITFAISVVLPYINAIPAIIAQIALTGSLIILPPIILIFFIVYKILLKKGKKQDTVLKDYNERIKNYDLCTLLDDCTQYGYYNFDFDLEQICDRLHIYPSTMKVHFDEVSGGGTTYEGWGGAGIFAFGLGLTALSHLSAKHKNDKINDRLKTLERYYYYNNIAHYVNSLEGNYDIEYDFMSEMIRQSYKNNRYML